MIEDEDEQVRLAIELSLQEQIRSSSTKDRVRKRSRKAPLLPTSSSDEGTSVNAIIISDDDSESDWTHGLSPPPHGIRWLDEQLPRSERVSKSLNLAERYADHLAPSVKEHVQNWRDQICRLGERMFLASAKTGRRGARSQFDPFVDLKLRSSSLSGGKGHRWAFEYHDCTLGWIVQETASGKGPSRLFLCNYATVLSLDVLTLGHSDKRGVKWMAGFFGEGVKVEINRLVSAGADVRYYTGAHQWTFFYEPQGPNRVLSVLQEPIKKGKGLLCNVIKPSEPWHTLIVLEKLPEEALLKPNQYVFLHDPRQELRCMEGYRVLLDNQLAQKVFVQGIYVQEAIHPIPWAFDYRGSNAPTQLKIGRDRNQAATYQFFSKIPSLYSPANAEFNNAQGLLSIFTERFYDYIAYNPPYGGSNFRPPHCPHGSFIDADHRAAANALLKVFKNRHGSNAVPTNASEQAYDDKEAVFLSIKRVPVQCDLFNWLRLSPECPTVEKIWQKKVRKVLALPEYVAKREPPPPYPCTVIQPDDDMEALFISLRDMIEAFFAPHIRRHQVRFKHFPHPMVIKRRLVKLEWKQTTYYILNNDLLAPESVHIEQKKADRSFTCPGGTCGCVRDIIVSDLLEQLPPNVATTVQRTMRRKLLALYDHNKVAPPAPLDLLVEESQEHQKKKGGNVGRKKRRFDFPEPEQSSDHFDPITNNPQETIITTEEKTRGPVQGLADSAPQAERAEVVRCLSYAAAVESDEIKIPGRPTHVLTHRCVIPEQAGLKITRSTIGQLMSIKLWIGGSTMGSDIHLLQKQPAVVTSELLRFAKILVLLSQEVFELNLDHVNIFWEDTERVAFNFKSSIFLNLRYAEAWMAQQASLLELLDYWYSIICHELAHNLHSAHDADHTRVMGNLVSSRMPFFSQLRQNIELSYESWGDFDRECAITI